VEIYAHRTHVASFVSFNDLIDVRMSPSMEDFSDTAGLLGLQALAGRPFVPELVCAAVGVVLDSDWKHVH
jgi:hypothetical protein